MNERKGELRKEERERGGKKTKGVFGYCVTSI